MFYIAGSRIDGKIILLWNKRVRKWISRNGMTFDSIEEVRKRYISVKRFPAYGQLYPEKKRIIDWDKAYESQCKISPVRIW